jgi:hypothetical protein
MPREKFYKVVRSCAGDPETFLSSLHSLTSVKYRLGKWVRPTIPGSRLFVFQTLVCAVAFERSLCHRTSVFECEACDPQPLRVCARDWDSPNVVVAFWKDPDSVLKTDDLTNLAHRRPPPGTMGARAIKLTRLVPTEEFLA